MSFSPVTARIDEIDTIANAIAEDDEITLFRYADLMKKCGDDEQADHLLKLARKAQRNQWAYDESINN